MLHQQDLVMISGVTNLTLQGLGTMETGPHETVMQSTVVIRCSRSTGGFIIMDSQSVTISTITVSGCAGQLPYSLQSYVYSPAAIDLVNLYNTRIQNVSVQNSSGLGLYSNNSFDLIIKDSSFYRNQYPSVCSALKCTAGNQIVYDKSSLPLKSSNSLDIIRSNFSCSGAKYSGSALSILLTRVPYRSDIIIDRVVAYGNTASYAANIFISISSSVNISINITLSVYGNMVPLSDFTVGAGLYVDHDFGRANISISNSNFSHNQANIGAGLYIKLTKKSTGKVTFNNCEFVNNTGDYGSALYIEGSADSSLLYTNSKPLELSLLDVNISDNQPYCKRNPLLSLWSIVTIQDVARAVFDKVSIFNV